MTALDDLCNVPFHDADAPRRARILSRLADTQMFVTLTGDAEQDTATFRIFELPGGPVAMAFDSDERLSGFFGSAVNYAAIPGRVLAATLRRAQTGLLVNPSHPSEMLLDASALEWLEQALSARPEAATAQASLSPPDPNVAAVLTEPLSERLADLRGMVAGAALVGRQNDGGAQAHIAQHLLVIAGAPPDIQDGIAKALSETLAFLPEIPGGIDIAFSDATLPYGALCFDLTEAKNTVPPRKKGPPNLR